MKRPGDPSDWFSPMLVKEVRQGLKARTFVGVFLLIQITMVCCMFIAMLPDKASESRGLGTVLFWTVSSVMIVCLMPLRGITALTTEVKERTFELVLLTRLSAWRIVMGKWASLVLQTLLVTSTLMPYLVLRYFLGGIDLILESVALVAMLLISGVLSAVAILTSSYKVWLGRLVLVVFQLWAVMMLIVGVAESSSSLGRDIQRLADTPLLPIFLTIALSIVITLLLLEIAADRVAPMAENHAIRKRGLLLLLCVINAGCLFTKADELMTVVSTVIATLVFMDGLCEEIADTPSVYVPFVRLKILGPTLGRLFYPGWPFMVAFSILVGVPLLIQCTILMDIDGKWNVSCFFLAYYVSLFLPVMLKRVFRRGKTVVYYAVYFAASGLLAGLIASIHAVLVPYGNPDAVGFVPAMAFILGAAEEIDNSLGMAFVMINALLLAWAALSMLVKGTNDLRIVRREERRAALMLETRRVEGADDVSLAG